MTHVETMLRILELNKGAYSDGSLNMPPEWRVELLRLAHLGAKHEAQQAIQGSKATIATLGSGQIVGDGGRPRSY